MKPNLFSFALVFTVLFALAVAADPAPKTPAGPATLAETAGQIAAKLVQSQDQLKSTQQQVSALQAQVQQLQQEVQQHRAIETALQQQRNQLADEVAGLQAELTMRQQNPATAPAK